MSLAFFPALGKRCHEFAKAGCRTLRALQDYYTPPLKQKQERQDVYVLTHRKCFLRKSLVEVWYHPLEEGKRVLWRQRSLCTSSRDHEHVSAVAELLVGPAHTHLQGGSNLVA
jgi:hypothetical protein